MAWNIAWSWQADGRIATVAAVEGAFVSSGLQLNARSQWAESVEGGGTVQVHAAQATQGTVGLLAAHGFYLINCAAP